MELSITFGGDQAHIINILTEMKDSIVSFVVTPGTDDTVTYNIEFKDAYSIYLFGWRQRDYDPFRLTLNKYENKEEETGTQTQG